ncbi:uncharacterized protein LOC142335067 isoform X2 [Convolutriloba macropyga]|uniref:uncharacterized protein LOC142335067 isoform X2 n=1 Tax=Convolutriloba macropyga TaxID=536237 RepID=UPI003F5263EF
MMTSNVKVHFKGVDPSATEVEFIDFLSRSAGGIKPINVKFFNPKGQIAVYKHGVAEYAKPEQASAVVALFGVLIETCEFKGRKLTSVAFFTDNSNANNSNTESGTNGRAGSHSPRYSNSQGGAGPEPELGPSVQKFKLCVYNIPVNADKGQLKSHLEQMSGVEIVDLFFVPRTGKTQVKNGVATTFSFVTYANNEHAEKVKALINNGGTCQFMGFTLAANYAFEKNPKNVLEENDSALAVNGYVLLIRSTLIVYGL